MVGPIVHNPTYLVSYHAVTHLKRVSRTPAKASRLIRQFSQATWPKEVRMRNFR